MCVKKSDTDLSPVVDAHTFFASWTIYSTMFVARNFAISLLFASFVHTVIGNNGNGIGVCGPDLAGLWKAVSPVDGSILHLTLRKTNGCDEYQAFLADSFWSFCGTDRGLAIGTATGLLSDDENGTPSLGLDFTIDCADSNVSINLSFSLKFVDGQFLLGDNGTLYSKISCSKIWA